METEYAMTSTVTSDTSEVTGTSKVTGNSEVTDIPVMLEEIQKLLDKGEQVIRINRQLLSEFERDSQNIHEPGRPGKTSRIDLSIIVPIYNEIKSIRPLRQELVTVLNTLQFTYEIIFVDDGSTDGSYSVLQDLHAEFPYIRVVQLRQNFGKSTALQAGFDICRGDKIITIDGDLQDDPGEIPRMLKELDRGWDLVSGWKMTRQDPWTKTVPSKIFNRVVSLATRLRLRDCNCGFKAYRKEVLNEIQLYGELHRFIPALAQSRGFRVVEIPVNHRPRRFGSSKFGAGRLVRGLLDFLTTLAVTKFRRKPFHLFGVMGLVFLLGGITINAYLSFLWFCGQWIENRPLFMLGNLLVIIGIQVIFFGFLADLTLFNNRRNETPAIRETLE